MKADCLISAIFIPGGRALAHPEPALAEQRRAVELREPGGGLGGGGCGERRLLDLIENLTDRISVTFLYSQPSRLGLRFIASWAWGAVFQKVLQMSQNAISGSSRGENMCGRGLCGTCKNKVC